MNMPIIVTVRCAAYNHAPYIRQCLEGFVMQKTDFRFEVIVHDDASTDGTTDIIREYVAKYPYIIKPIYETENQYSKHDGSLRRIMDAHTRGKYIALCEGDDYWIDPYKLQKQVDFLYSHPEVGLVYGKVREYVQDRGCFSKKIFGKRVNSLESLFEANSISTPTVLFRSEVNMFYDGEIGYRSWLLGDYPRWLFFYIHSKIHFMDEIFAVYRVLRDSASHSSDIKRRERFIFSEYDMKRFFNAKYEIISEESLSDNLYKNLLLNAFFFLDREKVREYYLHIRRRDIKVRIKSIICRYNLLFALYRRLFLR